MNLQAGSCTDALTIDNNLHHHFSLCVDFSTTSVRSSDDDDDDGARLSVAAVQRSRATGNWNCYSLYVHTGNAAEKDGWQQSFEFRYVCFDPWNQTLNRFRLA